MTAIGALEAFDADDFETYQERLEAYFLANNVGPGEVGAWLSSIKRPTGRTWLR